MGRGALYWAAPDYQWKSTFWLKSFTFVFVYVIGKDDMDMHMNVYHPFKIKNLLTLKITQQCLSWLLMNFKNTVDTLAVLVCFTCLLCDLSCHCWFHQQIAGVAPAEVIWKLPGMPFFPVLGGAAGHICVTFTTEAPPCIILSSSHKWLWWILWIPRQWHIWTSASLTDGTRGRI